MKKQTKTSKFFNIFAVGVTAFSVTFFVANLALAQYTGPALPPPDGNVNGVIWNLDSDPSLNNTPQDANVFISGSVNAAQFCFPGTPDNDCISSWENINTNGLWFPKPGDPASIFFNQNGDSSDGAPQIKVTEDSGNGYSSALVKTNNSGWVSQISLYASSLGQNNRFASLVWGDDTQVPFILRYTDFNGNNRDVLTASTNGNITMGVPSGNVGIGVSAPTQSLHTAGNIRTDSRTIYFGGTQRIIGNANSALYSDSANSTESRVIIRDLEGTRYGEVFGNASADNSVRNFGLLDADANWSYLAQTDSYTEFLINNSSKMRLLATDEVGLKDTTPDFHLEVAGTVNKGYFGVTNGSVDGNVLQITPSANLLVNTTTETYFSGIPSPKIVVEAKNDGITDGNIAPTAAFFISSDPEGVGVRATGGSTGIVGVGGNKGVQGIGTGTNGWGGYFENGIRFGNSSGLELKSGVIDEAGGWTNIGSNLYYDGAAWKKIWSNNAGASLHIRGYDAGTFEPQFRFRVVNADGTKERNIAQIGSDLTHFGEVNTSVTQFQGINFWTGASFNPPIGSPAAEGGQIALVGNGTNRSYIIDQYNNYMRIFGYPGTNTNTVANFFQNSSNDGRVGINLGGLATPASALQVNGTIRAQQYCNYDGSVCSSAPGGGGGGSGTITQIVAGTGINVQNGSGPIVTISATGGGGGNSGQVIETVEIGCLSEGAVTVSGSCSGAVPYCTDNCCYNGCKASCGPDDADTYWTLDYWLPANELHSTHDYYSPWHSCPTNITRSTINDGEQAGWCFASIVNNATNGRAGAGGTCTRRYR